MERAFQNPVRTVAIAIILILAVLVAGQTRADAATKSSCNGAVCEQVTHSAGTVSHWFATVHPGSGYHCRTARFRVNGATIGGDQACGYGTLEAYANTPYYLSSGDRLCAYFEGESGYACVTI